MNWDREEQKDERIAACIFIVALVLIALGVVFQPTVYPVLASLLRWMGGA